MPSLAQHDRASLERWMVEHRQPRARAGRLLRSYYTSHGRPDFDALERCEFGEPATTVLRRVESSDGTVKLLLGLRRGGAIETVMMQSYRSGEAWCCVSSQVGCAMGCDFCASTRSGLERNLEVDEIVEQYLHAAAIAAERGREIRRLVFMGMGEPLHNLDAVLAAIERIAAPGLGNLGWRRITVSTVGIVHGIERLGAAEHPVFLALSLHAPDDETRAKIVPTGKRYLVGEILEAARSFQDRTGRIVTIEYCLLAGVNDSDAQAELLASRLEGFRAHVNLIPYNATGPGLSGVVYVRPARERVDRFLAILRERGVVAHARDTRGGDVAAACGQLRQSVVIPPASR